MKKKLAVTLGSLLLSVGLFTGCGNHVVFDTTFSYDRVQIEMLDGSLVEGKVEAWTDYEGDQIQVKVNGKTYLTHVSRIILVAD